MRNFYWEKPVITEDYTEWEFGKWSGWRDLNSRHPAPKAGALPDCATPRKEDLDPFSVKHFETNIFSANVLQ